MLNDFPRQVTLYTCAKCVYFLFQTIVRLYQLTIFLKQFIKYREVNTFLEKDNFVQMFFVI